MKTIDWTKVRSTGAMDRAGRLLLLTNRAHMARYVATQSFAWPGGYLLLLLTEDAGILCPDCVRAEYRQIYAAAIARRWADQSWRPAAVSSLGDWDKPEEGAITCDHCNRDVFTI